MLCACRVALGAGRAKLLASRAGTSRLAAAASSAMLSVSARCASSSASASAVAAGDDGDAAAQAFLGDPSTSAPTAWKGIKRFYTSVSVSPSESGTFGSAYPFLSKRASAAVLKTCALPAWQVRIDGRPLRTNAMNELHLPTQALALAIAGEFAAQKETIQPATTPLYNLTCSAIDSYAVEDPDVAEDTEAYARASRLASMDGWMPGGGDVDALAGTPSHAQSAVTGRHESGAMTSSSASLSGSSRLRDLLLDFLETDSACFRIDPESADPSEKLLRKRQDKYYAPLLTWWHESYGVPLALATGLADLTHPDEAYEAAEDFCELADPFAKAAAASVIGAVKSTVITMAFLHRALDIEGAFQASRVEEEWQIAENGFVEDGHDTARAQLRTCLASASALLWLTPTSQPASLPKPSAKGYAAALAASRAERSARVGKRRDREMALVSEKRTQIIAAQRAADAEEAQEKAARAAAKAADAKPLA